MKQITDIKVTLFMNDFFFAYGPDASALSIPLWLDLASVMARDIFIGNTPRIFQRSNYYAICAIAGSLVSYTAVFGLYMHRPIAAALCVLATVALRRISLTYNLLSPADVDLTPQFEKQAERAKQAFSHNTTIKEVIHTRTRYQRWRRMHKK